METGGGVLPLIKIFFCYLFLDFCRNFLHSEPPVEIHSCAMLLFLLAPAQAVEKNASRNRPSTAGVEVLCTSEGEGA
jgi:hypothetical protein